MSDLAVYLTVALGVFVAVVYPVVLGYIRQQFPPATAGVLPPWTKKYVALLVFSLLTSLIVLAVYKGANPATKISFWGALAIGFGWESSVEKVFTPARTE